MLQVMNETIREIPTTLTTTGTNTGGWYPGTAGIDSIQTTGNCWPYTAWGNYPVYICTDKTKKAIEVLKALHAEKLLTCNSVPKFIELVEKIAGIL